MSPAISSRRCMPMSAISWASVAYLAFVLQFSCDGKAGLPSGFVYLDDVAPGVKLEIRYFSPENFVGDTIDGYKSGRCIITREAAFALREIQQELNKKGLGLKVYDAYRPQQAVDHFVRWAHDLPDTRMKSEYYPQVDKDSLFDQGYISEKSGHSRGSTVDLTIVYHDGPDAGKELDMGTSWDFFSPLSWPSSNEITEVQKANRMLLRKVMIAHGFKPLNEEWWHFTLRNEPFPDTYFNFPVQ
ncbi:MAG: M15 family metallopeptidase [Cytophagales bacterium]|nr:M15 family metallopeptidase [Cytophagales bacterium]